MWPISCNTNNFFSQIRVAFDSLKRQSQNHDAIRGSLFGAIPGVDARLITGDKDSRSRAADQIRAACLETGFFCIDNFLSQSTAHDKLLDQMRHFFDLPDSDPRKQAIDITGLENTYGWMPMFQEPAYQPGTIAHVESFDCGRAKHNTKDPNWTANRWPDIAGFRVDVRTAWTELTMIGMDLLRVLAEVLDLEEDFFVEKCNTQDLSTMRLLNYPAQTIDVDETADVGISAHTDFECITLISQSAPGLELMDINGYWYDAPARGDRLVVLLGDMLERWSNGAYRATGHRVRTRGWQRHSVVLFFGVNDDITVAPLDQFVFPDKPARFDGITQREHSRARLREAEKNRAPP